MPKLTKSGVKKFIRTTIRNKDRLYTRQLYEFDGMTDCIQKSRNYDELHEIDQSLIDLENKQTFGMRFVWFTGSDIFEWVHHNHSCAIKGMLGISVHNSCGEFIIYAKID